MDVHILTLFLFLKRKPKSYVNMNLIEPQLDLATTLHLHPDFISWPPVICSHSRVLEVYCVLYEWLVDKVVITCLSLVGVCCDDLIFVRLSPSDSGTPSHLFVFTRLIITKYSLAVHTSFKGINSQLIPASLLGQPHTHTHTRYKTLTTHSQPSLDNSSLELREILTQLWSDGPH